MRPAPGAVQRLHRTSAVAEELGEQAGSDGDGATLREYAGLRVARPRLAMHCRLTVSLVQRCIMADVCVAGATGCVAGMELFQNVTADWIF